MNESESKNHEVTENAHGFSLIELLVAVGLFVIITIVTTQSLATSLRNSRKSEAIIRTRENVDYAVSTMERLLRNAQAITACTATTLSYLDEYGNVTNFRCAAGYIASGSARLTSSAVVVDCSSPTFSCPATGTNVPDTVYISVSAADASASGIEDAEVTSQTKVLLRNYIFN